jgi:integrase
METACRRGGALALAPDDLDPEQCLIRLREKGETVRWQPVSPTLMRHLLAHGESRGGLGNGQRLLRYANGRPITKKRTSTCGGGSASTSPGSTPSRSACTGSGTPY